MTHAWGEKSLAADAININTQRLLNLISAQLEETMQSPQFEVGSQTESLQSISQAYIDSLVERKALVSGSVDSVEIVRHTWTSIYPKLFDRIRAMFARPVGIRTRYYEPRWFHVLFPFKTHMEVHALEEFFDADVSKEEYRTYIFPIYYSELVYPHTTVNQSISVVPVASVSHISLSFTVDKP